MTWSSKLLNAKAGRRTIQGSDAMSDSIKARQHSHSLSMPGRRTSSDLLHASDCTHIQGLHAVRHQLNHARPFTSASSWNLMRLLKQQMHRLPYLVRMNDKYLHAHESIRLAVLGPDSGLAVLQGCHGRMTALTRANGRTGCRECAPVAHILDASWHVCKSPRQHV